MLYCIASFNTVMERKPEGSDNAGACDVGCSTKTNMMGEC